jgi:hypothetical protein
MHFFLQMFLLLPLDDRRCPDVDVVKRFFRRQDVSAKIS